MPIDSYADIKFGVKKYLYHTSLIELAIEQGKQCIACDVRPVFFQFMSHFSDYIVVFITVEECATLPCFASSK